MWNFRKNKKNQKDSKKPSIRKPEETRRLSENRYSSSDTPMTGLFNTINTPMFDDTYHQSNHHANDTDYGGGDFGGGGSGSSWSDSGSSYSSGDSGGGDSGGGDGGGGGGD